MKFTVSGLVNIETNVKTDKFPIQYEPVRYNFFGINSNVSGVGYNVSKAFTVLGAYAELLSLTGKDIYEETIKNEMSKNNMTDKFLLNSLDSTCQSVILYDENGKRNIFTDLKNIQEIKYPVNLFSESYESSDLVVLCNINYSRDKFEICKKTGKKTASDVHCINNLDDTYNKDFMKNSDILFMSDEKLEISPEIWIEKVYEKFSNEIIVIGMGEKGALMKSKYDGKTTFFSSYKTRPVLNTIGAGDSLFSSFIYFYTKTSDPYISMRKACLFASWKIGESGASKGFLSENDLNILYNNIR